MGAHSLISFIRKNHILKQLVGIRCALDIKTTKRTNDEITTYRVVFSVNGLQLLK